MFDISPFIINSGILIIVWGLVFVLSLAALIKSQYPGWFKLALVPLSFAAMLYAIVISQEIVGRPFFQKPVGEFILINFLIDNVGPTSYIIIWAEIAKKHRLYAIKYDEETWKALMKAAAAGKAQVGNFDDNFNGRLRFRSLLQKEYNQKSKR